MTDKEKQICERVNLSIRKIVENTTGSTIAPEYIKELELACFDFAKSMPVSAERANFAVEIMHNMYLLTSEREKYPYLDDLETIIYPNFEFYFDAENQN